MILFMRISPITISPIKTSALNKILRLMTYNNKELSATGQLDRLLVGRTYHL